MSKPFPLVAERILNLAVDRVKAKCREALDAERHDPTGDALHPLTRIAASNQEVLYSAALSAQMVIDAEPGRLSLVLPNADVVYPALSPNAVRHARGLPRVPDPRRSQD